jgi:CRP-like cAMP-binding protein
MDMRKVLFVFGQLTDQDVIWLAGVGRRRRLARGAILIQEAVPVDTLYIVLEGKLEVLAGPQHRGVAQLLPGEMVGEMSFIDARPPSATVRAAGDAVVYAVAKTRLQEALAQDAAFAARFYKAIATFLSDRVRQATAVAAGTPAAQRDELDENVLDNVDRAGARFAELGRQLRDE